MSHRYFVFAFALAAFTLSLPARAGFLVYTAHELSFNLKFVSQDIDPNGNYRLDKDGVSAKEMFETCIGKPEKDHAIFLFIQCGNHDENQIIAIDKNPLDGFAELGGIDFDIDHKLSTSKGPIRKTALIPFQMTLSCLAGEESVQVSGIMEIKYSAVAPLDSCPESAKAKVTGVGFSLSRGGALLVNEGSSLTVKKRSPTISTPPNL